jgi:hypothetical protein
LKYDKQKSRPDKSGRLKKIKYVDLKDLLFLACGAFSLQQFALCHLFLFSN